MSLHPQGSLAILERLCRTARPAVDTSLRRRRIGEVERLVAHENECSCTHVSRATSFVLTTNAGAIAGCWAGLVFAYNAFPMLRKDKPTYLY